MRSAQDHSSFHYIDKSKVDLQKLIMTMRESLFKATLSPSCGKTLQDIGTKRLIGTNLLPWNYLTENVMH